VAEEVPGRRAATIILEAITSGRRVAEGPLPVVVIDALHMTGASRAYVDREAKEEIVPRRAAHLRNRPPLPVEGKSVVVAPEVVS